MLTSYVQLEVPASMHWLVDVLRASWRSDFVVPSRHMTRWGLTGFVVQMLWTAAGVVPGALVGAYIVQRWHITGQLVQDLISIGFSILGMLILQIAFLAISSKLGDIHEATLAIPLALAYLAAPFLISGGAAFAYFTDTSTLSDVAATGAGGALIVKVLIIPFNRATWPALKGGSAKPPEHM